MVIEQRFIKTEEKGFTVGERRSDDSSSSWWCDDLTQAIICLVLDESTYCNLVRLSDVHIDEAKRVFLDGVEHLKGEINRTFKEAVETKGRE